VLLAGREGGSGRNGMEIPRKYVGVSGKRIRYFTLPPTNAGFLFIVIIKPFISKSSYK
jgi:hypothetical protein